MTELTEAAIADGLALLGLPSSLGALALRKVLEERQRRVSKTLAAAEALTGMSREILGDRIAASPEEVPLLIRVLQAAGSTGNDRTLEMLGRALGEAHRDPYSRPRQELIVMAIDGLSDEHLEVLAVCSEERKLTADVIAALAGRVPADVAPMALTSLVPRGLFENPYGGYGGGEMWGLSELGRAVKDAALAAFPRPTQAE